MSTKRQNWSQLLPRTITVHGISTLRTLADVRALLLRLPPEKQSLSTWQHVAATVLQAAGDGSTRDVYVAVWLVLQGERDLSFSLGKPRKLAK